ncbi:MAG: maleylpyruvate isomerase N-terminal domain-containing protein [Chloroflexi bacterium]|nr:maleylpyruvate isomerase N-terminal domain-containing protein [Chloroflexota bacterium]
MAKKDRLKAELEAAEQELFRVIGSVSMEQWERETQNVGWTVKDTLAHLLSGETGNLLVAKRVLGGESAPVKDFDLHRYNQRQVEKLRDRGVEQLREDLKSARRETLTMLEGLTDEQLATRGRRTTGEETTLEAVFRQIARHMQTHADDIRIAIES